MLAGKLDRRIDLLATTQDVDAMGGPTKTTAVLATVWAEKRNLRGRERFAAAAISAEIDTVFRIRYRDDVTPVDAISCDGRTYDVVSVAEIGRREGLEIMATARADT